MEKETNFSVDDKGKGNYIIRTSGTFEPEKYLAANPPALDLTLEEYRAFIEHAITMIYGSLITENKGNEFHTVGVWLTFDDGETIDNAMDISVLESMAELGGKEVIPIFEFAKMTLDPYYEGEISE